MPNSIKYRDHDITRDHGPYDFSYSHKDYDGAPDGNDNRCGYHDTIDECKEAIDEWHDEQEGDDPFDEDDTNVY